MSESRAVHEDSLPTSLSLLAFLRPLESPCSRIRHARRLTRYIISNVGSKLHAGWIEMDDLYLRRVQMVGNSLSAFSAPYSSQRPLDSRASASRHAHHLHSLSETNSITRYYAGSVEERV